MFVRLVCNYLPTALWFHLALGLIFIGLHDAWQPLVTSHWLFVISQQHGAFKKTEVCLRQREGNSYSSKRISVILRGNLWEYCKGRVKERVLGMEFRDESQILSPYFTQGAKLQMTSPLFSTAKQISRKWGPGSLTAAATHQSQVRLVAWCDISQEGAE